MSKAIHNISHDARDVAPHVLDSKKLYNVCKSPPLPCCRMVANVCELNEVEAVKHFKEAVTVIPERPGHVVLVYVANGVEVSILPLVLHASALS